MLNVKFFFYLISSHIWPKNSALGKKKYLFWFKNYNDIKIKYQEKKIFFYITSLEGHLDQQFDNNEEEKYGCIKFVFWFHEIFSIIPETEIVFFFHLVHKCTANLFNSSTESATASLVKCPNLDIFAFILLSLRFASRNASRCI